MTERLKTLTIELAVKTAELNKVSAAYTGNANSATPALEVELKRVLVGRNEMRADAALGLVADETALNKEIARIEAELVISRRDDLAISAVDEVLSKRTSAIYNDIQGINGLILAERKGLMAIEITKAEERVEKAASAFVENLMQLEKTLIEANKGELLREPRTLFRLPENFTLPLLQKPINVDISRRAGIHDKVGQRLDEILMR